MPANRTDWTVELLDALPDDGQRYELIDGELFVTPAPSDLHQLVAGLLCARLWAYLRPWNVGRAFISPSDVRRADRARNRLQPDVFVIRLRDGGRPAYPFELSDLLLAVEVESPSNPAYDYQTKRELYLLGGVPEYWVVSPVARTLARWRGVVDPGELVTGRLEWQPGGMPEAFVLDLPEFFEEAFG
ncbi:MAG TPA: Uma2 family endonuclease [Gemmatimonadaceae bacterium]|nr:Uma2 family endonuclease [Gemmatimonadaceae bacterium]